MHKPERCFYLLLPLILTGLILVIIHNGAVTAQIETGKMIKSFDQKRAFHSNIQIQVEDESGYPINDAIINIPELGIYTRSDPGGNVILDAIPMPAFSMWMTLTVAAEGYGEWKMENLQLVAQDNLRINPILGNKSIHKVLPDMETASFQKMTPDDWAGFQDFLEDGPDDLTIPSTIRVRITGDWNCDTSLTYTVETIDFNYYVKHVLPSEWNSGVDEIWPDEAYRAGAIAVKMYGWYWISQGGKWNDADVYDSTCDQLYNPEYSREFTDRAVDYTWDWRFTRDNTLFPTYYRSTEEYNCPPGVCMSQWGSKAMAENGHSWDEILYYYYTNTLLTHPYDYPAGWALEFNGSPGDDGENRVLIPVDDPESRTPGLPVDIGGEDFTIEWWMKTDPEENYSSTITMTCGDTQDWMYGNILFDRYLPDNPGYGISLSEGRIIFGIRGQNISETLTLCGSTPVDDGNWHHIAVQRRRNDGFMWVYIDGLLDATAIGPPGDISYPDTMTPSLPAQYYLSIGGLRDDVNHLTHPFYRGWIDEIRISNILRYTEVFTLPQTVYSTDEYTVSFYKFDEKLSNIILDTSGAAGGPSDGIRAYGGEINGPERWPSSLFVSYDYLLHLPVVQKNNP